MNRATLAELQRQRCYPSITLLLNTTPGVALTPTERNTALMLLQQADDRLDGDVSDALRRSLTARLSGVVDEHASELSTQAIAVFVSPEYTASVRLANAVDERVAIDDTFTTRDLIADLTRTASYSVFTISERLARRFVGDRRRLVEVHDNPWPLVRNDDQSLTAWTRTLDAHLRAERGADPLPMVIAGVHRSVRQLAPGLTDQIGVIPGNHDRSSAEELRLAAWPLVDDWLTADAVRRAIDHLDEAVSARRYAGGIHEVWALGHDGRIATLVVESGYRLPARVDENNQLHPADDAHHPDVNDDVVDDAMEVVLLQGGTIVVVDDGVLSDHQRIAAILRY